MIFTILGTFATKGGTDETPAGCSTSWRCSRFRRPTNSEAPTGFDNKSNGLVDDATHQTDQDKFDEIEGVAEGLGPLYNAQSCRECHQNPTSGGTSQITELRVGHQGPGPPFSQSGHPDCAWNRSHLRPYPGE